MKYPEDRLYLRVGNLVREIKYYTSKVGNLEAHAYISNIALQIKPDSNSEYVIKTEKHILSPDFLTHKCFRESNKENIKSIIRDYKLNQLV